MINANVNVVMELELYQQLKLFLNAFAFSRRTVDRQETRREMGSDMLQRLLGLGLEPATFGTISLGTQVATQAGPGQQWEL